MKIFFNSFCIVLFLFLSNSSWAEIYKDFTVYISLKEVKKNYPNAKFENLKPAWAKDNELLVLLTGAGISGDIILKFSYSTEMDQIYRGMLEKLEQSSEDKESEGYKSKYSTYQSLLYRPDDEKFTLDWLRWVPIKAIPIERLISRYGDNYKCGFSEEDFKPYCSWDSKGVYANTSDNKKHVFNIEYYPTVEEIKKHLGLESDKEPAIKKSTENPRNKKKI